MQELNIRLPMRQEVTKKEVVQLVLEWMDGSALYKIPDLNWQEEYSCQYQFKTKKLMIEELQSRDIIAIHYEIVQYRNKLKEVIEIVFDEYKHMLYFKYRQANDSQKVMFHTVGRMPGILRMFIDNYMTSNVCDILPSGSVTYVTRKKEYKVAERLVKGTFNNYLPVVYITKDFEYEYPLDPAKLANFMAGRAIVVAEEDPLVRDRLAELEGVALQRGYVMIYYPNSDLVKTVLNYHNYIDGGEMAREVTRLVNHYWSQKPFNEYQSFDGIARLAADEQKEKLQESHAEISKENAQLYRELDAELSDKELTVEAMREKIVALTKRLQAVEAERDGLQNKLDSLSEMPILFAGDEKELYAGEAKAIVLDALSEQLEQTSENTRRHDVLTDVLQSNDYDGELRRKREAVKKIFGSQYNMETICKKLGDIGIESEYAGKHIKLTYYGDERYISAMALTPSDHRSARNQASLINKTML